MWVHVRVVECHALYLRQRCFCTALSFTHPSFILRRLTPNAVTMGVAPAPQLKQRTARGEFHKTLCVIFSHICKISQGRFFVIRRGHLKKNGCKKSCEADPSWVSRWCDDGAYGKSPKYSNTTALKTGMWFQLTHSFEFEHDVKAQTVIYQAANTKRSVNWYQVMFHAVMQSGTTTCAQCDLATRWTGVTSQSRLRSSSMPDGPFAHHAKDN